MTEDRLIELGFEAGVLNYQEIGTDRHYYVTDAADTKDLMDFAKLIAKECADLIDDGDGSVSSMAEHVWCQMCVNTIKKHFGLKVEQ